MHHLIVSCIVIRWIWFNYIRWLIQNLHFISRHWWSCQKIFTLYNKNFNRNDVFEWFAVKTTIIIDNQNQQSKSAVKINQNNQQSHQFKNIENVRLISSKYKNINTFAVDARTQNAEISKALFKIVEINKNVKVVLKYDIVYN